MMDSTLVVYLSDSAEGHHPVCKEWPFVLIGDLGGRLKLGNRYLRYPWYGKDGHRTINSLYLALLHSVGDPMQRFGLKDSALLDLDQDGPLQGDYGLTDMSRLFPATFSLLLLAATASPAEHRSALLIGNSDYQNQSPALPAADLAAVAAVWEKSGVQCKALRNLDHKKLKSSVEDFANHSPTNGSAIVYFSGQAIATAAGDVHLLGTNAKPGDGGYLASELLTALASRGGSRSHLLIIDGPPLLPESKLDTTVPEGCQIVFGGADLLERSLPGGGTRAISPPDRFMSGQKIGDEWVNARGTVFCWCPPGTYSSGSPPVTRGASRTRGNAR